MISVIMPVYNAGKFLKQSIDGVLSQTEKDFEFIIVNDGSTDNSEEIILSYKDPRIVYVSQENQGEASARNKGLDIAKGDFIAWQDADDISLPIRLEIMRKGFISDAVGFVHCDMLLVDEKGSATGYWQHRNTDKSRLLRFFLKKGSPCSNCCMMVRKKALGTERYDASLKVGCDSDMFFRTGLDWNSVHIAKPLYVYRLHANNLSRSHGLSEKAKHIRKLLSRHSLQELAPELSWQSIKDESNPEDADNRAKACAIISLLLSRREMKQDADKWLERAMEETAGLDGRLFVRGIKLLQDERYDLAGSMFRSCPLQDCVVTNYLGEVAAFSNNTFDAYRLFIKSIELNPYYVEPIDNLRGLGSLHNFRIVDTSWSKFRRAS